jgi:hypothetical protein
MREHVRFFLWNSKKGREDIVAGGAEQVAV